jgi:predicted Fe-S protein YdhL (DUF1289 family)
MDEDGRYCLGCRRTLGEIARWTEMSDAERASVMAQLAARVDGNGAAPGLPVRLQSRS